MKRILILLLLSSYLLCITELSQLLRIPVLIEHFTDHKKRNADVSFMNFLVMHYAEDNKDIDSEPHKQLPFKSHQIQVLALTEFLFETTETLPIIYSSEIQGPVADYNSPDIGSDYLSNIWQPPKYC